MKKMGKVYYVTPVNYASKNQFVSRALSLRRLLLYNSCTFIKETLSHAVCIYCFLRIVASGWLIPIRPIVNFVHIYIYIYIVFIKYMEIWFFKKLVLHFVMKNWKHLSTVPRIPIPSVDKWLLKMKRLPFDSMQVSGELYVLHLAWFSFLKRGDFTNNFTDDNGKVIWKMPWNVSFVSRTVLQNTNKFPFLNLTTQKKLDLGSGSYLSQHIVGKSLKARQIIFATSKLNLWLSYGHYHNLHFWQSKIAV